MAMIPEGQVLLGLMDVARHRESRVSVAYLVTEGERLVRLYTCGAQAFWTNALYDRVASTYEGTELDLIAGNGVAQIERIEFGEPGDE